MASNFTQVPNQTRSIGLSLEQVGLLEEIIAYTKMDGSGVFYESKTELARKFNTSRPRIIRLMNSLVKQNIIYQSPTKNKHDTLNITLRPIEDWIPIPIKAAVTKRDTQNDVTKRAINCNNLLHQPSQNVTSAVTKCDTNNIRNNINNNKSKNSMGDAYLPKDVKDGLKNRPIAAKSVSSHTDGFEHESVDAHISGPSKSSQQSVNEIVSKAMDCLYTAVKENLTESSLDTVSQIFISKQKIDWANFKREWYPKLDVKNCKAIWAKTVWGWVKESGPEILSLPPPVVAFQISVPKLNTEPWEWNLKMAK